MAATSVAHSVAFTAACGAAASDGFRSSRSNGVNGVPLRALGKARFSIKRNLAVSAKLRKVKKHDYPWPADPDPNVKGGVLTHLSHFKPLKEKPKPVTLPFEEPLVEIEKKIIDVITMDWFMFSCSFYRICFDSTCFSLLIGKEDGQRNWTGLQ